MSQVPIYIKESEKGKAVHAGKTFREGEFVLQFTGKLFTREEYLNLHDPDNNHYVQVGEDIFMGPSGNADDLINHSCNPNCGLKILNNSVSLYAIRNIDPGEEITFDYSTTMDEGHWEMDCCCGDPMCRKKVKDYRHLPEKIKKQYISQGIVPEHIMKSDTNQL